MRQRSDEEIKEEFKRVTDRINEIRWQLDRNQALKSRLDEVLVNRVDIEKGDKVVLTESNDDPLLPTKDYSQDYDTEYIFVYRLSTEVSEEGNVSVCANVCLPNEDGEMPQHALEHCLGKRYKTTVIEPYQKS